MGKLRLRRLQILYPHQEKSYKLESFKKLSEAVYHVRAPETMPGSHCHECWLPIFGITPFLKRVK
jgi:hypothetical protein